eukprot:584167-Rhodomonas_salina.1
MMPSLIPSPAHPVSVPHTSYRTRQVLADVSSGHPVGLCTSTLCRTGLEQYRTRPGDMRAGLCTGTVATPELASVVIGARAEDMAQRMPCERP